MADPVQDIQTASQTVNVHNPHLHLKIPLLGANVSLSDKDYASLWTSLQQHSLNPMLLSI